MVELIKYKGYKIELDYDQFATDPTENGNYLIHINNGRHQTGDPDQFDKPEEDGGGLTKEAKKMIKEGLLWPLDIYEHGNVIYRLTDDIESNNGWIEFTPEYATNFSDKAGRRSMAESDLEEYTAWANGEVYTVNVFDPYGDEIEDFATSDVIGLDWIVDEAKRLIDGHGINYATKAKSARELHQ